MDYIANIENSEIDVSGIRTVLVQGDSSYPVIRFVLDPSLTGLSWRVRGTYTDTNIPVISPEITPTESATEITLDWSVSSDFTTYYGNMQLVVVGANDSGTVITKALGEVTIQRDYSIGTMAEITLNLFEQLMAQADAAISKYPTIIGGNWYVWNVTVGEYQDTGVAASSQWKSGTGITGTSTTPTAFPSSGITMSNVGDMYLNSSTGNTYRCTTSGAAAVALWIYVSNITGPQPDITDGSITNAKLANMANNTIKGNVSGGAAAPSDLTVAQVRGIITEGTSEVDAIADGDKLVIEDVSATAGVRTKHVLWSAIKTALRSIFMPYDATSTNLLINGGFDIWQRGTSFSSGYAADRWKIDFNGTGATRAITRQAFTVGQTDVPNNPTYYLRYAQSVAGSGGTYSLVTQRLEDVSKLSGKTVTLSFYAKADSARNVVTRVDQYFGSGGSSPVYVGEATHSLTTSWQLFTRTVTLPSVSGKTIGASNFSSIYFLMPFNTTFTVDIANVQLNYGDAALLFVPRSFADELRLCQRYYIPGVGSQCCGYAAGTTMAILIPTTVQMRSNPSVTATILDNVIIGTKIIGVSGVSSAEVRNNGVSIVLALKTSVAPTESGTTANTDLALDAEL